MTDHFMQNKNCNTIGNFLSNLENLYQCDMISLYVVQWKVNFVLCLSFYLEDSYTW